MEPVHKAAMHDARTLTYSSEERGQISVCLFLSFESNMEGI